MSKGAPARRRLWWNSKLTKLASASGDQAVNADDVPTRRKRMAVQTDNGRVVVLSERLAEATHTGDAEWLREAEDVFVWKGEQGSVSIGSRDHDGEPPYQLVVLNSNGERLDELTSQLVGDDRPAEWNKPLADLYRAARRSALRADDVIEALIEALPHRAARAPDQEPDHGVPTPPSGR
jgi:hypothetical protein